MIEFDMRNPRREVLVCLVQCVETYKHKLQVNGEPLDDFADDQARKLMADADHAKAMARANALLAKIGLTR